MFDPSQAWSSGSQFESSLADFFAAFGFEAEVIEAKGGTGERVIWLEKINTPQKTAQNVPQPKDSKPASEQIKQVQTNTPSKNFKQFVKRPQKQIFTPKLAFRRGESDLRQEVHKLPHVKFRKVKNGR